MSTAEASEPRDGTGPDALVVPPGQRLDIGKHSRQAYRHMLALGEAAEAGGPGHTILELVKTRVSQINGCAHCLDMHTLDARAYGETEQRLHALAAWREAPFYTARERAALGLAESLTRLIDGPVEDDVFAAAADAFDDAELAHLIWAITVINGWNRIAIASRRPAGEYTPGMYSERVA